MKNIIVIIVCSIVLTLYMVKRKRTTSNFTKTPYDSAYDLAMNYLNTINAESIPGAAVMFDIDDTLLSVNEQSLTPIKPIIKILKECNDRGITVVIITARDSRYTIETMKDLADNDIYPYHIGYPEREMYYNYLYLRVSPNDDTNHFKTKIKDRYKSNGINIIMSIGDNLIDIEGENSGYGIKLPNKQDPRLFHINGKGQLQQVV